MPFILNRQKGGIQYPPFQFVEDERTYSNCPPLPEDHQFHPSKYALDCDRNEWVMNPEFEKTQEALDIVLAKLAVVREERNKKIDQCVWMVERHREERLLVELGRVQKTTLREEDYEGLLYYIQDLRDVTNPSAKSYIDPAKLPFPVDLVSIYWPQMPPGVI